MKIGVDATPLTIPFPCGTRHYSEQLLGNLAKIDNKNQYIIFASKKVSIPNQANFKFVKIPSFIPVLKRQLFLASYISREKVDVFHNLEPYGAIFFKHPRIITTVHDLNLKLTYPILSKRFLNRLYCEIARRGVFKNTKTFITMSSTIKKELVLFLKKLNKKAEIEVIYNGVNEKFKVKSEIKDKKNYFLCMGDFASRKNISRVFEAYSNLPDKMKNEYRLKVVASTDSAAKDFSEKIESLSISNRVDVLLNVSVEKLVLLYRQAAGFLFPSLYEGFGLPILEAMACECPVITSNYGAMKEVAKDAGLLVNPRNIPEISKAMIKIVDDRRFSESLKRRGLKRAEQFSWKETATKTLKVYAKTYKTK